MSSQHQFTTRTFRPAPDEFTGASANLPEGKTMDAFLRACLRGLRDDPEAALAFVETRWPAPKKRGRPSTRQKPSQDTE